MMLISWKRKPQRGLIEVLEVSSVSSSRAASHFIGWNQMAKNMRAFRYATSNPYRVPKGTLSLNGFITSQ